MAIKLKDFVTNLAKKAGYDTESEEAKTFFTALADLEVPDGVQKGIDNALISLSEAKNNYPDIKNHYTKQALDGIDKEIMSLIEDFQLDEQNKGEILAEKSSYKRVPILARRLVELERKKAATTGGKDKAEIQKQIDDLHAQVKAEKDAREAEKKSFDEQILQNRIATRKNVLYGGVKTIHDDLDSEVRYSILDSQILKALQDSQAKLAFDEQGNFILIRNDGTNYFGENHQQVKPGQFIEQVLAKNKQLKVSDSSQNGSNGATNKNGVHQPANSGGNGARDNNQTSLIEANKRAVADLEAAAKQSHSII